MEQERLRPANAADALVRAALTDHAPDALAALAPHLPAAILQGIARVVEGRVEPEDARRLGQVLEAAGLVAAAAAAYGCHAEALPLSAARAEAYAAIVALERAQGLSRAAAAHERVIRRLTGQGNSAEGAPELADGPLAIRSARVDAGRHARLLASLPLPPLAEDPLRDPFFTKPLWMGDGAMTEDHSFFVVDAADTPVLLVECDLRGDRYLGCREVGVQLTPLDPSLPPDLAAEELALRQLDAILAWSGSPHLWLEVPRHGRIPPAVAARMVGLGPGGRVAFRNGWIELGGEIAEVERAYRATTRQRVRWGRANLETVCQEDGPGEVVEVYGELHRRIGRPAALERTVLEDALARGRISGFVGLLQGEPVGLVLTSHHGKTTYDLATIRAPGVKHPVSHLLVHLAIEEAGRRGQERFHFGPLYEGGEFGAKFKSIAEFKTGFASRFEDGLLLRLGA